MGKNKLAVLAVVAALFAFVAMDAFYTVDQTQTAIVLQLGKPVSGAVGPGLHFKKPLIQNVLRFDARILEYDSLPAEILTKDKKNMLVDNFTKWKIVDPLQFYRTVQTIPGAQARLDDIIYSEMRVALGQYLLIEVVNQKRAEIMDQVSKKASEIIREYGIEVVDVRIKRTDLPPENERAIFGRMRAERERQAKQYRSEGQEESAKIRSDAERERTVILADAERQSSILRGQGDAEATKTYAQALEQGPDFYSFQRSLEAYEKSFQNNTTFVLTPQSEFFRYLR
ncbi:MAG: protease modulator HflC [Thermodesulfobacteriota bacterium]